MTEMLNLSDATVIKAGNSFCVALRDGRMPHAGDHPLGVYLHDCRFLRSHELWLDGRQPRLLIASDEAGSAAVFEFTNPDLVLASGQTLPLQSLRVRLERRMEPAAMLERVTLRSHAREPVRFELQLRFDADFRSMLEVRGLVGPITRHASVEESDDTLRFAATGADGVERSTVITCPGAIADRIGELRVPVELDPGGERTLDVQFALVEGSDAAAPIADRRHDKASQSAAGAEADAWLADRPRMEVDDKLLERVLRRSLLDLRLLASNLDGWSYYAAGVPWYSTLFGRDSIITALETLAFDPAMGEQTLRLLAGRLGARIDDEHDEEPGKVVHELREGELAAIDATPLVRYYGTVDATPLFLCLLCEHADWTGSLDLFRELRPQVDQALGWIGDFGDLDGDGLLEYLCRSPNGLVNQGWKDSWDGVADEHGTPLRAPVALVEVQAYVACAKRRLARLFELDGDEDRADRLRAETADMEAKLERFWLPDLGWYAMGLDADKRASRALASNQGHLLWAEAVGLERAAAVRDALLSPDSYSGWGVRTLGAAERAFNPVGYHTGTIWPHDNALFALGLRNYGFDSAFLRVFEGLLEAAASFKDYRLPELFAGFSRTDYEQPVPYPVACSPQAWAAGALPALVVAGLGLAPDGLDRKLRVTRPSLPAHLDRLSLRGLRIADARVDLVFERVAHGSDRVALVDAEIDGDVDIVLEIRPAREQGQRAAGAPASTA